MKSTSLILNGNADVSEKELWEALGEANGARIFSVLLRDQSRIHSRRNKGVSPDAESCHIIWATDNYTHLGSGFRETDHIMACNITNDRIIRPRSVKPKSEQAARTRDKAEVFTPSWVCNAQNNLVDNAWFGRENVFNTENPDHTWSVTEAKITFPEGKDWLGYIADKRLEITCGEAPYLASRYDTVTGEYIPLQQRIGMLDRKLRVVAENTTTAEDWLKHSLTALSSVYGFEWQGDNLLIARETLLCTWIENFFARCPEGEIPQDTLYRAAEIISWNLWQMDGLKGVVPMSCTKVAKGGGDLFDEGIEEDCPGCKQGGYTNNHTGIKCLIQDWDNFGERSKEPELFNKPLTGKK